jgi:uracil DNA glycosylase
MDKKNKICTSHPSPLGFKKEGKNFIPFYNSKVFSKINEYLKSINKHEIN